MKRCSYAFFSFKYMKHYQTLLTEFSYFFSTNKVGYLKWFVKYRYFRNKIDIRITYVFIGIIGIFLSNFAILSANQFASSKI